MLNTARVIALNQPIRRRTCTLAKYGINSDDYMAMLADQNNACAICLKRCETRYFLCVDHDHKTGIVRGLLCSKCNAALGLMKDDIESLHRAIKYLSAG